MEKPQVIEWIARQSQTASLAVSVCAGAFLPAKAKVLETHKVTTHWEDIVGLSRMFTGLNAIEKIRWVDAGTVVTSGGISAGIDMSLHLVSRLHSQALAEKTARQMEFAWTKKS